MRPQGITTKRCGGLFVGFLMAVLSCLAQPKEEDRNPPLSPTEGLRVGRALVADLWSRRPTENSTNTGTVRVRDAKGKKVETSVRFSVFSTSTNWVSVYETAPTNHPENAERLTVVHHSEGPSDYVLTRPASNAAASTTLTGPQIMVPFAGSDFWVADLGLEFLRWPAPRVLRREMRKGRAAQVLEARNPQANPAGYSRVVAWMDTETGGVLHADAYDAKGELLKVFDPTGVRKHELEEMEMRNLRTDSHTWIKFDLAGR